LGRKQDSTNAENNFAVNVQFTWPLRGENLAMAEETNGADLEEATKFDAFT
jgi:hypothetical protein